MKKYTLLLLNGTTHTSICEPKELKKLLKAFEQEFKGVYWLKHEKTNHYIDLSKVIAISFEDVDAQ